MKYNEEITIDNYFRLQMSDLYKKMSKEARSKRIKAGIQASKLNKIKKINKA
jgi:hypothetical protein